MGLFGAFIVLKKNEEVPVKKQHIIQLQEWNHLYGAITLLKVNLQNANHAESILINGRDEFQENMAPLETYEIDINETHLFRMIGVASAATLLFSVPGIPLIVKETDGYPFVQKAIDEIIIYPAERYDFELDLRNVSPGRYNMTVEILEGKEIKKRQNIAGLAFVIVTDIHERSSESNVRVLKQKSVLNFPFEVFPKEPDAKCIPVSYLKSTNHYKDFDFDLAQHSNETFTYFLNFAFPKPSNYSSINGHRFMRPTVAALLQPSELDTSCSQCESETSCKCTYALNLKSGSEIIMVLSNIGSGSTMTHPIHMHGHTYEVLKMGFPTVTETGKLIPNENILCNSNLPNSKSQCNNATWRNESWRAKSYRNKSY